MMMHTTGITASTGMFAVFTCTQNVKHTILQLHNVIYLHTSACSLQYVSKPKSTQQKQVDSNAPLTLKIYFEIQFWNKTFKFF